MENIYDPYIYHQVDQSFRHYYLSEPLLKKKTKNNGKPIVVEKSLFLAE